MRGGRVAAAVLAVVLALVPSAMAGSPTRYGDVEFPKDEHHHADGWDFWWGAASLTTTTGNHYTVGIAFDSLYGFGVTGHELFAFQGPYVGKTVTTMDGPAEWGHPGEPTGRYVREPSTYVAGVSDLLDYHTLDTANGMKDIGRWQRTSLDAETYHLRLDDDEAKVHPDGNRVKFVLDLQTEMRSPPLLAGGTGRWWYGIPETFGYPSRSFQYVQASQSLTGTLDLGQPGGSVLHETVDGSRSTMLVIHEYDASPEDLFAGLGLAFATQVHPRYAQYYLGGMPWELVFANLSNGAQLMLALIAFHDTPDGTLRPVGGPNEKAYKVLATLRLPDGRSIPLDDDLHVEHLSYRTLTGLVPTFWVQVSGVWVQAWKYRVSYGGGTVTAPDGSTVTVPAFDLGLVPQIGEDDPAPDAAGNRLVQRVPYGVAGSYNGCGVSGFGWSELIVNWYGHEDDDPWANIGGSVPPTPAGCGSQSSPPPGGTLDPSPQSLTAPSFTPEGCQAFEGSPCGYTAMGPGGFSGYGAEPGGWTATITGPSHPEPVVIRSRGGPEAYACGAVRTSDHVALQAGPGSWVTAGNPGICY